MLLRHQAMKKVAEFSKCRGGNPQCDGEHFIPMTSSILRSLCAALLCIPSAHALQINLTYATNGQANSVPAGDADGSQLMAIAEAAAAHWEGIIKDAHTLNLTVQYNNGIGAGFIGLFTETAEAGGRVTSGLIDIRGNTAWYYDATPTNHSEFQFAPTLFRNAVGPDATAFTGTVPGVLEINFTGNAGPGSPILAQTNSDLLTTLLHEMGHALGMTGQLSTCATELQDNDYDFNTAHTNGNVMAATLGGTTGAHTTCVFCVMNPTIGTNGLRRLPCAADVLALATCPNPGWSQIDMPRKDFLPGGTTVWNTAANWVGGRLPDAADLAALRYGIDVPGDPLISLNAGGVCGSLLLTSATRLRTTAQKLDVTGTATLDFDGNLPAPEIFVENGGELEATDVVVNGGELYLTGGLLDIADDLTLSDATSGRLGILTGYGTVEVDGTLRNDGRIDAGDAQTLVFNSPSLAPWDLDGAAGNGEVLALLGSLNFATGAMSDAFDGLLQIEDPHTVTFGEPWTLGAGGVVRLNGGNPALATLAGALLEANAGSIEAAGRARITGPLMLGGSLEVVTAANAQLMLDGLTTVTGGGFLLGANAVLEFNNNTGISGGTFLIPDTATVRLDGTHTLEGGSFTGAGTLAFNGTQTIIDAPVTVQCATLDFDGPGGAKQVHLNSTLTINSTLLNLSDNTFNATLNLGTSSARLIVNGPASWTMAGTLNHTTGSAVFNTSLSGAPVTISGSVNVSGSTRWNAKAGVSGTIQLTSVADRLLLGGGSPGDPNRLLGGTVSGNGSLRAANTHLHGHGTLAASVDFLAGSSLMADNGTLRVAGAFLSVPPTIGTAESDGILEVVNDWLLPAGAVLELNGGIARGGDLEVDGVVNGHGALRSDHVTNNNAIAATGGQTLVIDTTGAPDLDGVGSAAEVAGHLLEAMNGNITVVKAPTDAFGAQLRIGAGRTATFQNGWILDAGGSLNLTAGTLAGGSSILRGGITANGACAISAPALFDTGSVSALDEPGDALHLTSVATINAGAVFTGGGRLVAAALSTVTLAPLADVGVHVENSGGRIEIASGPGTAKAAHFTQSGTGTLAVEILGAPASIDYDQLTVTHGAALAGRLEVIFNVPGAQAGDTWKVLAAGSVTGGFAQITAAGVPAGHQLLLIQTADAVYVKLSRQMKYSDWAQSSGLTPPDDGIAADPDLDGIGNGLEMFLGGDPLKPDPELLPSGALIKLDNELYLSITLPVALDTTPSDLVLIPLRSTDLMDWKQEDTVVEVIGHDPSKCIEFRLYRSAIPFDTLPREYFKVAPAVP